MEFLQERRKPRPRTDTIAPHARSHARARFDATSPPQRRTQLRAHANRQVALSIASHRRNAARVQPFRTLRHPCIGSNPQRCAQTQRRHGLAACMPEVMA